MGRTGSPSATTTRRVVVGALVIGPALAAVVASFAAGAEHPYPGVALGSPLVLELERAAAVWALWLLALVVGERAVGGELPDKVSGRGVEYADAGKVDTLRDSLDAAIRDLTERVDLLSARDQEDEDTHPSGQDRN